MPSVKPPRQELSPRTSPVDALIAALSTELAQVNQEIRARMTSSVPLIPQLAEHLIASGGKRLRPLLTLAASQLVDRDRPAPVGLAAAVEFIHTATLLHDDVVDGSALRRGQQAANRIFGNKPAILVGDFLFARAFELMVESGELAVLDCLARAASIIAEGEVAQLQTAHNLATDRAAYYAVIEAKTAALFAAACEVSGIYGQASKAEIHALRRYGQQLGIAFQISDDALDYDSARAQLGKQIGDDFRDGKVTLPVILAYADATSQEREFWQRVIGQSRQEAGDLASAQALLERHDALARARAAAKDAAQAAVDALAAFPPSEMRERLAALAHYTVARQS